LKKKEAVKSKKESMHVLIFMHVAHTHSGKNTIPYGQSKIRNYIMAIMSEQSCLLANLASANVEQEIDVLDKLRVEIDVLGNNYRFF
jgi:hypothetical protein